MNGVLRLSLYLVTTGIAIAVYSAPDIQANGLIAGKAVLTIDGQQVFLSQGQTKHGVTLLAADEDAAVIEVNGKKQTLLLDKSIARQFATPEEFKRHSESKSHVVSSQVIHQTGNLATFEVEYYFAGKQGDSGLLTAKTLYRGKLTKFWAHTHTPLEVGRNITNITVAMNEQAPERYLSDQIQFEILWHRQEMSGHSSAYVMDFIKQWER